MHNPLESPVRESVITDEQARADRDAIIECLKLRKTDARSHVHRAALRHYAASLGIAPLAGGAVPADGQPPTVRYAGSSAAAVPRPGLVRLPPPGAGVPKRADVGSAPTEDARRLKGTRLGVKLTMKQLAELTGVGEDCIQRTEKGQRKLAAYPTLLAWVERWEVPGGAVASEEAAS